MTYKLLIGFIITTAVFISGMLVGFIISLSNYCFLASLLVLFITGSKLTKFRSNKKRSLEEDFKEGRSNYKSPVHHVCVMCLKYRIISRIISHELVVSCAEFSVKIWIFTDK